MQTLILAQLLAVMLMAMATGLLFTLEDAGAVLYGGGLAVAMLLLMRRSTDRALEAAVEGPGRALLVMYSGLAMRYALALLGLLAGFKALQLSALGMITGFVLTIVVQVFAIRLVKGPS